MRFIYLLIFVFETCLVLAQEKSITIKGEIFDAQKIGINNSTVKISDLKTGRIFKYLNTGKNNFFNEVITLRTQDTLLVTISHTSYNLFEEKVLAIHNPVLLKVILEIKTKELRQVEIEAPKNWVRGDTTFYRVDAYKEGNEKKLKDLLIKLPDFRIDEKGKMLYKNKVLDKVTIDHEEMFADKVELLLNNFPVHVLNTIQAIENQSNQKLLKGLDGANNTFLNLELKKGEKIKTVFGDTEMGVDNLGRYNFSPVVFSMYGKLKVGFIGNWNKIGNGVSYELETELKNKYENEAAEFLMNTNSLSLIHNFENRRYVRNNQWDNRIQLNTRISQKVKSQFQFSYIKDKQSQDTYNNSSLYTNNGYVQRTDTSANLYRPKIFSIKENLIISLDSISELNINGSAYLDQSGGNKRSLYDGLDINSPLYLNTTNNWSSYSLMSNYTRRPSQNRASTFFLNINSERIKQNGQINSNDLGNIFEIEPSYDFMNNNNHSNYTNISLGWSNKLKNASGNLLSYGVTATYLKLKLNNSRYFESQLSDSIVFDSLQDQLGNYSISTIAANFSKSFKFLLRNPFLFTGSFGVNRIERADSGAERNSNGFTIGVSAVQKHNLTKAIVGEFRLLFKRDAVEAAHVNQFFYPSSLTNFRKYNGSPLQQEMLNLTYALSFSLPNDLTSISIAVFYNNYFRSQLHVNTYNRFFQYDDVYSSPMDTRNLNFNAKISHPAVWLNAMLDFNVNYTLGNGLMLYNNNVVRTDFNYYIAGFSIRKNWDKKIFVKINPSLYTQSSKLPTSNHIIRVRTFRTDVYQRYVINNQLSFISNFKLSVLNIGEPRQVTFPMLDVEFEYRLKNKPVFFSLKADNLTNQRKYYFYYNSEQLLNYGTIPLVSRNFYLSAKYNF